MMSDMTRSHQHQHPLPHPQHQQPQPQQPLGHHHTQPLPHHLHHYAAAGNANANSNNAPTLGGVHANKRYGVSVPPVVLGNSSHDAHSPYGSASASAMYGSLYAHQQALKDRMEYAFQQHQHQQQQQQQYNGGGGANANNGAGANEPQNHGHGANSQGYFNNPAAYSIQHESGLSFGVQDSSTPQQPGHQHQHAHHAAMGMPQLPEMQLPPQHHDTPTNANNANNANANSNTMKDGDGARKFRPLSGSMYLGSPSVYGSTTADQRATPTSNDSYLSSIRFQHQQQHQQHQHQQQQQQHVLGGSGYRPVMHSYNAQATSQAPAPVSSSSSYYVNQTSRLAQHQQGQTPPDLMTPAMAAAANAVAHGLRANTPQNMSGGRLPREMDNPVRIQTAPTPPATNQQPQPPQQPASQPQQQPQPQQDVVCSFCYGPHCDRAADGCGHRFHHGCLQAWGEKSFTCPLCIGSSNQIKLVTPTANANNANANNANNGPSYNQQSNQLGNMQQGYHGGSSSLDLSGARGSADLPPTPSGSSLINAARQRSRVQQRPPPIDTTRALDAMPVSKLHVHSTPGGGGGGQTTPSSGSVSRPTSATSSSGSVDGGKRRSKGKKPLKECSIPGCGRTVRSRGLCKGHGGGRRCGFPGCGLSDQGGGFCISHGGGKRCQFESCENSAQSRGLCKLHGGGSRCTVPNCTKSSQGRGLCRAHGGGRRCMIEGCNKTDRRAGYCVTHGADKKCVVPECSKTGRIDGMCTKHYFERNQAVLASQAQHAMLAAAAASKASRDETRAKKKMAPKMTAASASMAAANRSKASQLTPATSPTTPSLLNSLNAVSLLSSASAASSVGGGGMHSDGASGGLGLGI